MTTAVSSTDKSPIQARLDPRKGRLLVTIEDDVLSTTVPDLRRALLETLNAHHEAPWKALYLDMRAARMIDSMGINWLFAESVRLKELNKALVVRISSPAIHRVMQFAGLDRLVTLKYRHRKQTR